MFYWTLKQKVFLITTIFCFLYFICVVIFKLCNVLEYLYSADALNIIYLLGFSVLCGVAFAVDTKTRKDPMQLISLSFPIYALTYILLALLTKGATWNWYIVTILCFILVESSYIFLKRIYTHLLQRSNAYNIYTFVYALAFMLIIILIVFNISH